MHVCPGLLRILAFFFFKVKEYIIINQNVLKIIFHAGEMAQWLGALIDPLGDLSWVPSRAAVHYCLPVTPGLEDLASSSGLSVYLHTWSNP